MNGVPLLSRELMRKKGIGEEQIEYVMEVQEKCKPARRPEITCPAEAIPLLAPYKDQQKEHFVCLFLNARNQMVHQEVISIGSLSASIVHPREVFRVALRHAVASIILAHNHPSGDVSPSKDDLELTRRLVKAGQIMGIEVLDHLIIGCEDWISLKEKGLM